MIDKALDQIHRRMRAILLHQTCPVDVHRARADRQQLADLLAGLALDQLRGNIALPRGQLGCYGPLLG